MAALRQYVFLTVSIAISISLAFGQHAKVDARNTYERLWAVVPIVGSGTVDDPLRPKWAPLVSAQDPQSRTGILGYQFIKGDDGLALVEFVGANRAAFRDLLTDSSIIVFLKGRDARVLMEAEFLKHKKNFDFARFGVRMP